MWRHPEDTWAQTLQTCPVAKQSHAQHATLRTDFVGVHSASPACCVVCGWSFIFLLRGSSSRSRVSEKGRCWLSELSSETAVLNKQMTIKEAFHRQLHQGSRSVEIRFRMSVNSLFSLLLDHMVCSLENINNFDWQSNETGEAEGKRDSFHLNVNVG